MCSFHRQLLFCLSEVGISLTYKRPFIQCCHEKGARLFCGGKTKYIIVTCEKIIERSFKKVFTMYLSLYMHRGSLVPPWFFIVYLGFR